MLAEDRLDAIVNVVNERGSVTASELMELLGASESTIRRDLTRLAREGRVSKVHGGATAARRTVVLADQAAAEKHDVNLDAKLAIARHAAALIGPDDLVYIDAGSTTARLCEAITEVRATYMTNSIANASMLASKGCRVLLPAGELKSITGALVGEQAVASLSRFHFSLGFFGTNGATPETGFTTPETGEAQIKETALSHTIRPYVLADSSKFSMVSTVTFADFDEATIITESIPEELTGVSTIELVHAGSEREQA